MIGLRPWYAPAPETPEAHPCLEQVEWTVLVDAQSEEGHRQRERYTVFFTRLYGPRRPDMWESEGGDLWPLPPNEWPT